MGRSSSIETSYSMDRINSRFAYPARRQWSSVRHGWVYTLKVQNGQFGVKLASSKAKVTPLKIQILPKLELEASTCRLHHGNPWKSSSASHLLLVWLYDSPRLDYRRFTQMEDLRCKQGPADSSQIQSRWFASRRRCRESCYLCSRGCPNLF